MQIVSECRGKVQTQRFLLLWSWTGFKKHTHATKAANQPKKTILWNQTSPQLGLTKQPQAAAMVRALTCSLKSQAPTFSFATIFISKAVSEFLPCQTDEGPYSQPGGCANWGDDNAGLISSLSTKPGRALVVCSARKRSLSGDWSLLFTNIHRNKSIFPPIHSHRNL